jgi:hypothetical protein
MMPAAGTVGRWAWPIVVDTTNRAIRVTCNSVAATLTLTAGTYYWLGDGTSADLAKALDTCLQTHAQSPTTTVTIAADGSLVVTSDKSMTLHLGDPLTTLDEAWLGCAAADYAASGAPLTITSPYQIGHCWNPETRHSDDTGTTPRQLISRSEDLSGVGDVWLWASIADRSITYKLLPMDKVFVGDAPHANEAFATLYAYLITGGVVEWTPDITVPATHAYYVIPEQSWLERWPVERRTDAPMYFQVRIPLRPSASST